MGIVWVSLIECPCHGLRDFHAAEQLQQARRFAEVRTKELERVKEALEPRRPPAVTNPKVKESMKAWLRTGRVQERGWQPGSQVVPRGFST